MIAATTAAPAIHGQSGPDARPRADAGVSGPGAGVDAWVGVCSVAAPAAAWVWLVHSVPSHQRSWTGSHGSACQPGGNCPPGSVG